LINQCNILYAGLWEVYRKPWTLESGDQAVEFQVDGWRRHLDGNKRATRLPKSTIGIVGITVSAANPDRLWAIVEAEDGGVFRSDDAGKTWTKTNEQRNLRQRAWYYLAFTRPKKCRRGFMSSTPVFLQIKRRRQDVYRNRGAHGEQS